MFELQVVLITEYRYLLSEASPPKHLFTVETALTSLLSITWWCLSYSEGLLNRSSIPENHQASRWNQPEKSLFLDSGLSLDQNKRRSPSLDQNKIRSPWPAVQGQKTREIFGEEIILPAIGWIFLLQWKQNESLLMSFILSISITKHRRQWNIKHTLSGFSIVRWIPLFSWRSAVEKKCCNSFCGRAGLPGDVHHLYLLGSGCHILPACLLAARDGAKPSAFWMFCLIDIVQRM